mgnify:CR=1 FL=1
MRPKPAPAMAALERMGFQELKRTWIEQGFGTPPRLRRRLLAGLLAYKLQERSLGGLSPATARLLREIAGENGRDPDLSRFATARIKPGTRLQRVWKGELHEVTVLNPGFAYRGNTYPSLSLVARQITGTRWSGPLFFGLRDGSAPDSPEKRP